MNNAKRPSATTPIVSKYADDPEMSELVGLFVSELPQRTDALLDAFRTQQWEIVQRISHQLKGASAGYGFPTIGAAAGKVEDVVRSGPIAESGVVQRLDESVRELVALCQRAKGSHTPR